MSELIRLSLAQIRERLAAREASVTETVQSCLSRIEDTEPAIHAMVSIQAEQALSRAAELDAVGPDPARPLWGVPLAVKDLFTLTGAPATCGSRILANFKPFYDATCVTKLLQAGAVILGKTNMDEFAMGSSTESSAFGPTFNPWDTSRVPGGSSGGSAASVAACQCFGALGTDTGGSIRQPASLCGCVGIKPTYGLVSRYGLIAYGSSLDQAGPLARTVEDTAILLAAIAGHDERDSTSARRPPEDYPAMLEQWPDLEGVRLGLPKEYWGEGCAPEVEKQLRKAVETAEKNGAVLVDISLPHTEFAVAAYYIIAMAEASSNLARFDGVRYGFRDSEATELVDMYVRSRSKGFGEEVQRRIMLGTYVLSAGYYDAYYRKAAQVRRIIRQDFIDAFEKCDVICGAVSPVTAWKIGALTQDPLQMYLMDIFTNSLNLAGLPGLSLPVGLGEESGMPVGLQMIGRDFDEGRLLAVANALARLLPAQGAPKAVA